eukprot:jgi/Tetstr1/463264/TSEL_008189.t1
MPKRWWRRGDVEAGAAVTLLFALWVTSAHGNYCGRDRGTLLEYAHGEALGWVGATSFAEWEAAGVSCEDGRAYGIVLPENKPLPGPLPTAWSKLVALETFEAVGNEITGSLPREWSVLRQLWNFVCADQLLTGSLPPQYSRWLKLEELNLEVNKLEGPLPIGYSRWLGLRMLALTDNGITGALPVAYSGLTSMMHFLVDFNHLDGAIPEPYSSFTNLLELSMYANLIVGPVPAWVSTLRSLETLDLGGNALSGTLPAAFSSLQGLAYLGLAENRLVGSLPPQWSALARLLVFHVHDNRLSGTLPEEYSTLGALQWLDLSSNDLSGGIPPQLSALTQLTDLELSYNYFNASVPPQLSALTDLKVLSLGDSELAGSLPPQLSALSQLGSLWLQDAHFSGLLPAQYSVLTALEGLYVHGNWLTGPLPPEWSALAGLNEMHVGDNNLTGTLPAQWSALSRLAVLDLADNDLQGGIPQEWGGALVAVTSLAMDESQALPCVPPPLLPALRVGAPPWLSADYPVVRCGYPANGAWLHVVATIISPVADRRRLRQLGEAEVAALPTRTRRAVELFLQDVAELTALPEAAVVAWGVSEAGGGLAGGGALTVEAMAHFPPGTAYRDLETWQARLRGSIFPRLAAAGLEVLQVSGEEGLPDEHGSFVSIAETEAEEEGEGEGAEAEAAGGGLFMPLGVGAAVVAAAVAAVIGFVVFSSRRRAAAQAQASSQSSDLAIVSRLEWAGQAPKGLSAMEKGSGSVHASSPSPGAFPSRCLSFDCWRIGKPAGPDVAACAPPPGRVPPRALPSLVALLADSYRAHVRQQQRCGAGEDETFGPFAACLLAAHLRLALEMLKAAATSLKQRAPPAFAPGEGCNLHVSWHRELRGRMRGKLGSGAFGTVYQAEWRGMDVAVKMLLPGKGELSSAAQMMSFKAEIEIMAALSNKGCDRIVRMYGACVAPPNVCIIYEYVPGGSLHDTIYHHSRRLTYPDVLRLGRDIAEGLAFLHTTTVHRDLKPENILLGADGRARICDLGLGRIKDPLKSYLITSAGGTPFYMAPETFTQSKLHEKADIYALGVILNEMASRQPPWDYETPFQVIYAVSVRKERPALPASCPQPLADIIERCWAQDDKARPTAAQLVRQLDALMGATVNTQPDS